MSHLFSTIVVTLAQAQRDPDKQQTLTTVNPSDVSDTFNQGIRHDLPWELLLVGIGATITAIVTISLRRWWLSRHDEPSPIVLYSAIARKAGLGWRDRFLLWRIARACDLPTPITLLLSKGTLRHYSGIYLSNRSGTRANKLHQRLGKIEAGLFL